MHLIKHCTLILHQCIRSSQRSSMSKHILNGEGTRYVFIQSGVDQLCLIELQACALLCQFHWTNSHRSHHKLASASIVAVCLGCRQACNDHLQAPHPPHSQMRGPGMGFAGARGCYDAGSEPVAAAARNLGRSSGCSRSPRCCSGEQVWFAATQQRSIRTALSTAAPHTCLVSNLQVCLLMLRCCMWSTWSVHSFALLTHRPNRRAGGACLRRSCSRSAAGAATAAACQRAWHRASTRSAAATPVRAAAISRWPPDGGMPASRPSLATWCVKFVGHCRVQSHCSTLVGCVTLHQALAHACHAAVRQRRRHSFHGTESHCE